MRSAASLAIAGPTALLALGLCTLALGACGNTLQDQPISHNTLESLLLAPYPVYWLGGSFQGMAITEASQDPSGAFAVQYGDCVGRAARTPVSPACGWSPHPTTASSPARLTAPHRTVQIRGVAGVAAQGDETIELPTARCGGRHLRRQPQPRSRRRRRRPCRSTKPALPPRRCPRRCRTRALPSNRYPVRRRLPCAYRSASSNSSGRCGAHGDRHPCDRTQLACVVAEAHIPHPCRAPPVQPCRVGMYGALRDRAQEARAVRQAHRGLATIEHSQRRSERGQRLGDRGVDTSVKQTHRLLQLVAQPHPGADLVVGELHQLQARTGGRSRP